jgi:hypothetical protein
VVGELPAISSGVGADEEETPGPMVLLDCFGICGVTEEGDNDTVVVVAKEDVFPAASSSGTVGVFPAISAVVVTIDEESPLVVSSTSSGVGADVDNFMGLLLSIIEGVEAIELRSTPPIVEVVPLDMSPSSFGIGSGEDDGSLGDGDDLSVSSGNGIAEEEEDGHMPPDNDDDDVFSACFGVGEADAVLVLNSSGIGVDFLSSSSFILNGDVVAAFAFPGGVLALSSTMFGELISLLVMMLIVLDSSVLMDELALAEFVISTPIKGDGEEGEGDVDIVDSKPMEVANDGAGDVFGCVSSTSGIVTPFVVCWLSFPPVFSINSPSGIFPSSISGFNFPIVVVPFGLILGSSELFVFS